MNFSAASIEILWLVSFAPLDSVATDVQSVEQLEAHFGITVTSQDPVFPVAVTGGQITGAEADGDVHRYLSLMVRELSVYPRTFIKRSQLKRIVVCKDLAYAGQKRAAIPDFGRNVLYLDCQRGNLSSEYQRTVIHHEFFHMVDYRDDGLVYRDDSWSALNSTDFKYGKGGSAVQDDFRQAAFRNPTAGFLTTYSMSGVEEDKAELFSHLIVNAPQIEAARASDGILDSKVIHLKAQMRRFCDQIDAAFWKRAAARSAP